MYYEINVSKNGKHYFATAARSLTDEHAALVVIDDFQSRFPESEGFKLSLTYHPQSGQAVDFKTKLQLERVNAAMCELFDKHGIRVDGPGDEAFWNAVEDLESKCGKDSDAALRMHQLANDWEMIDQSKL